MFEIWPRLHYHVNVKEYDFVLVWQLNSERALLGDLGWTVFHVRTWHIYLLIMRVAHMHHSPEMTLKYIRRNLAEHCLHPFVTKTKKRIPYNDVFVMYSGSAGGILWWSVLSLILPYTALPGQTVTGSFPLNYMLDHSMFWIKTLSKNSTHLTANIAFLQQELKCTRWITPPVGSYLALCTADAPCTSFIKWDACTNTRM